jgi:chromosome segregation ATPase
MRSDCESQIENLQQLVENTQSQRDAIADKLKSVALDRDRLEDAYQSWQNENAELSKLNAHNSSEVESLKQQLNEMTAANSEISAENARLWIQVETLMTQKEVFSDELIKLKTENSELIQAADELFNDNDTQKNSFDEELKALSMSCESTVKDLKLEIDELSQLVITKSGTISSLQNDLSKSIAENTEVKLLYEAVANELGTLRSSFKLLEKSKSELILDWESKIDDLEKENAEMMVIIQELENKLRNQLMDQSDNAAMVENLIRDNSSLTAQLKTVQNDLVGSKRHSETLSAKNLDLERKVEELHVLVSSYSDKLEKADTELCILLDDAEAFKEKFKNANDECCTLRARLKSLADELAKQQEHLVSLEHSKFSTSDNNRCTEKTSRELLNRANLDQQLIYYLKLSETSTQSMELYRSELVKKQEELKNADMEILRLQDLLQSGNFPQTT